MDHRRKKLVVNSVKNSNRLASFASKPHDFGSLSNGWKSLGQSGITVPLGECLGCLHCAAGQCEGSQGIFRGQTRGCKTKGAQPPRFCSRGFARGKFRGSPHTASQYNICTRGILLRGQFFPHCPKDFQQLLRLSKSWGFLPAVWIFSASELALSASRLA